MSSSEWRRTPEAQAQAWIAQHRQSWMWAAEFTWRTRWHRRMKALDAMIIEAALARLRR